MNFAVEWTEESLAQLAALWTDSDDRSGVADASYRIEAAIRNDPFGAGESREDNLRYVFDPPLAVLYEVVQPQQLAIVTAVGPSRRLR